MCTDLSSGVGVASQQPDCCFTPPSLLLYRKAWVFSVWGCDVQLKGRIETDYLVNSWHPLAAWNRPERQGLICKWITPLPSPSLPSLSSSVPSSSFFFFFFLKSIRCQNHLFILCHDRCCAGLPLFPVSFSGTARRAKRFPHVIFFFFSPNTRVPPAV